MHGTVGTLHIMDRTGHTSITWDPSNEFEVGMAKDAFNRAVKGGYQAFNVDEDDERGSRLTKFDPQAGKIMMVPQLVGG
jgi:hypothetical protein